MDKKDIGRISIRELRVRKETKDTIQKLARCYNMTITAFISKLLEENYGNFDINEFLKDFYARQLKSVEGVDSIEIIESNEGEEK